MNLEKETALLEAILFLESDPISISTLILYSGFEQEVIQLALEHLAENLTLRSSGLELRELQGGWMLAPKTEFWEQVKNQYGNKQQQKLSKAALETLSIIAYSQPVTRASLESIRGVSADTMIRFLLDKKLIKKTEKLDVPGKPMQYITTKEFLKLFNLNSIADLPKLDEMEQERFEVEDTHD
jgi:segregation and condensation protein B